YVFAQNNISLRQHQIPSLFGFQNSAPASWGSLYFIFQIGVVGKQKIIEPVGIISFFLYHQVYMRRVAAVGVRSGTKGINIVFTFGVGFEPTTQITILPGKPLLVSARWVNAILIGMIEVQDHICSRRHSVRLIHYSGNIEFGTGFIKTRNGIGFI